MAKEKTNIWGQTFFSERAGLWKRKGGVTKIESDPALGKGWWVSTPKEGFVSVFRTLKEALSLKWD